MNRLAPGIVSYTGVFPKSEQFVTQIENQVSIGQLKWLAAITADQEKNIKYENSRITNSISLKDPAHQILISFKKELDTMFFDCLQDYSLEYRPILENKWEIPSLLKYSDGMKYTNHIDDYPAGLRRVSFVYYINSDYFGGEIEFPRFGLKMKPRSDELLIFPSNYVYNHSVHPVTSGTRYSVVNWCR